MSKVCTLCKTEKPYNQFSPKNGYGDNWSTRCKSCIRNSMYGLPPNTIERTLVEQDHRCKICGKTFGNRKFTVDHCHKTNVFRGLLCYSCNNGLGHFRDDPVLIQHAIDYLREFL